MKLKKIFSILILITLLALAVYYIKNNLDSFRQLTLVSPQILILLFALFLFNYFIQGIVTIALLAPFKINLSLKESFGVSIVTGFYNLITPFRGGMVVRAAYLKKKHQFSYTDFLATLSASYVLIFFIASLLGLTASYFIYKNQNLNPIIFSIFLITFLSMSFIIVFSPKLPQTNHRWIGKFVRVVNGWHLIKGDFKIIFSISALSLIQLLIATLTLKLQFLVFGLSLPFYHALFLTSISSLGILIAITPANLGISEVITVFSALTIGITPAQSLAASLLGRAVSLITLFTLGPIFSYVLLKEKKSKIIVDEKA